MGTIGFDVAHLLAGSMLVLSFVLLYQDRITAVLNVFALQAIAGLASIAFPSETSVVSRLIPAIKLLSSKSIRTCDAQANWTLKFLQTSA